jgi:hypothetical protein
MPLVQAVHAQDLLIGGRELIEYPKTPAFLENLPTACQWDRVGLGFQACLLMKFPWRAPIN